MWELAQRTLLLRDIRRETMSSETLEVRPRSKNMVDMEPMLTQLMESLTMELQETTPLTAAQEMAPPMAAQEMAPELLGTQDHSSPRTQSLSTPRLVARASMTQSMVAIKHLESMAKENLTMVSQREEGAPKLTALSLFKSVLLRTSVMITSLLSKLDLTPGKSL